MRATKAKAIRRKAKEILVDWICKYIPDEERKKVTPDTVLDMMPDTGTHIYAQGKTILSAWSFKWVVKNIKQLLKSKSLETISVEDIENAVQVR